VHAGWVPRLLKEQEMETRVPDSKSFLRCFDREGNDFLNSIITTDETWLHLHDPETKQQSAVWKRPGSPPPEKARACKSSGKYMFIFFFDRKGMLLQHAVPKDTTVNAAYYSKVKIVFSVLSLRMHCWCYLITCVLNKTFLSFLPANDTYFNWYIYRLRIIEK